MDSDQWQSEAEACKGSSGVVTRGDVKYQMSKLEKNKIILVSQCSEGGAGACCRANIKLNFIVLLLKFDICFVWEKNQEDYRNFGRKIETKIYY